MIAASIKETVGPELGEFDLSLEDMKSFVRMETDHLAGHSSS